jgi:hypothetical protein
MASSKPGTFQLGNQLAKGRRAVPYDKIWKQAIVDHGKGFLDKLIELRDSEKPEVVLRACDTFWKYARPVSEQNDESVDATLYEGLTVEQAKALKGKIKEVVDSFLLESKE